MWVCIDVLFALISVGLISYTGHIDRSEQPKAMKYFLFGCILGGCAIVSEALRFIIQ